VTLLQLEMMTSISLCVTAVERLIDSSELFLNVKKMFAASIFSLYYFLFVYFFFRFIFLIWINDQLKYASKVENKEALIVHMLEQVFNFVSLYPYYFLFLSFFLVISFIIMDKRLEDDDIELKWELKTVLRREKLSAC
jgi:hypothetical protein